MKTFMEKNTPDKTKYYSGISNNTEYCFLEPCPAGCQCRECLFGTENIKTFRIWLASEKIIHASNNRKNL